jgi:hypothetical protein
MNSDKYINIMDIYLKNVYKDSIVNNYTLFHINDGKDKFLIVKGNDISKYKVYIRDGYPNENNNETILYERKFNNKTKAIKYYKECQESLEKFMEKKIL